jgi:hypothetical protein
MLYYRSKFSGDSVGDAGTLAVSTARTQGESGRRPESGGISSDYDSAGG